MRKILLVEDEVLLREAYEMILSSEPYVIHSAPNGAKAWELCQKNDYDLILLDLMMPILDGVAFLERYAQHENEIPKVIVLSNLSSGDEITRALDLGAIKSAVKANLSPKQLISLVRYELKP